MKKTILAITVGILFIGVAQLSLASPIISYVVPYDTEGTQKWTGALGMDFNVLQDISITSLGVFDDGSDGLNRQLTVRLYNRQDTTTFMNELIFGTGVTGTLIGGSRFLELTSPIELTTGFQGSIVAFGYGENERNGNKTDKNIGPWNTNDGNGLISFVGDSRYSRDTNFPTIIDNGPEDRYAAGTFMYEAADFNQNPVPEPTTMLLFGVGLLGIAGVSRRKK